ncbi:hypothetical protein CEH05_16150 [Halobacillus halophilus]|uniref:Uncharacterized protein n=1 Tax=Halobacillus halophilus (strain ATCC 35676 / DSM 2266 / JCM 20832 / KCTC 3685 / LMG 17431 / NBRC 102448 / NCIMB 2269) TaxID=866895 RepID=I0JR32_HALH3|nr:hypothetical protein [Halobacillus halophilus]ASF40602.1 hypothetical protein CEH05_16150 [Halobacillus halophilus]CCG46602.1 hypothetical protein HBHAL_4260 [Halobacillus halophilus DSM 2266]
MKTYVILFMVVFLMHGMTLVNVTLFDGNWNGIVLMLSNLLFLVACVLFGTEIRARRRVED